MHVEKGQKFANQHQGKHENKHSMIFFGILITCVAPMSAQACKRHSLAVLEYN
jgi:hypothetical protein